MKKSFAGILAASAAAVLIATAVPSSARAAAAANPITYCDDFAQCAFDKCLTGGNMNTALIGTFLPICSLTKEPRVSLITAERCRLEEAQDFLRCLAKIGSGRPTKPEM